MYLLVTPASINKAGNTRTHFLRFQITKQRCILISARKCSIHEQHGVESQKTHQYNIRYPSKTGKYSRKTSFSDLQTKKRANRERHTNPAKFKAHCKDLRSGFAFCNLDTFEIHEDDLGGSQSVVKCLEEE